MPPERRRKIPEATWLQHKPYIKRLRETPSMTTTKIAAEMKDKFAFDASNNQYDNQFKNWGWKKYHSAADWEVICPHLRKHCEKGDDIVLSFRGDEIPEKTWRERLECQRLDISTEPLRPLPPGYLIRPKPRASASFALVHRPLPFTTWSSALPKPDEMTAETSIAEFISDQLDFTALASNHSQVFVPMLEALIPRDCLLQEFGKGIIQSPTELIRSPDSYKLAYVRFLVYAISNNFAGIEEMDGAEIWSYIQTLQHDEIRQLLPPSESQTTRALAEKLFFCAVEAGDTEGADLLLDLHTDIDLQAPCPHGCHRGRTALSIACIQLNDRLVSMLLTRGAKVTQECYRVFPRRRPLQDGHFLEALPRILQLLAEKDANINTANSVALLGMFHTQAQLPNGCFTSPANPDAEAMALVLPLILNGLEKRREDIFAKPSDSGHKDLQSLIRDALWVLDRESAVQILGPYLRASLEGRRARRARRFAKSVGARRARGGHCGRLDDDEFACLRIGAPTQEVLRASISTGNVGLVRLFRGYDQNCTIHELHATVYLGDVRQLQALLEAGGSHSSDSLYHGECIIAGLRRHGHARNFLIQSIDAPAHDGQDPKRLEFYGYETCLSIALTMKNTQIIPLLQTFGCMRNIHEPRRFYAALEAALRSEAVEFATQLIERGFPLGIGCPFQMAGVVESAVKLGLERVALDVLRRHGEHLRRYLSCSPLLLGLISQNERFTWEVLRDPGLLQFPIACTDVGHDSRCMNYIHQLVVTLRFGRRHPRLPFFDFSSVCGGISTTRELLRLGLPVSPASLLFAASTENIEHFRLLAAHASTHGLEDAYPEDGKRFVSSKTIQWMDREDAWKYVRDSGLSPKILVPPRELAIMYMTDRASAKAWVEGTKSCCPGPIGGYGSLLLRAAIRANDVDTVQELLQNGVTVPIHDGGCWSTPLAEALVHAQPANLEALPIIRLLIEHTTDINAISSVQARFTEMRGVKFVGTVPFVGQESNFVLETPLLAAIETKSVSILQLLLDGGANFKGPVIGVSQTPLQKAAQVGSKAMVELFISLGVDVNDAPLGWYGATALQHAAMGGYGGIVELLIKEHADVLAAGALRGGTAIELAAKLGRLDTVQLLISTAKFDDEPGASQAATALRLAKKGGHKAVVSILELHLCQPHVVSTAATSATIGDSDGISGRGSKIEESDTVSGDDEGSDDAGNWDGEDGSEGYSDDSGDSNESMESSNEIIE